MKSKRIIAGVLAATVCFTVIPAGVSEIDAGKVAAVTVQEDNNAVESEKNDIVTDADKFEVIRSGNISETITYKVYDNGLMVITGYGSLYGSDIDKTGVTSVIVEDKDVDNDEVIDTIESSAFLGYTELESLVLPDNIKYIEENVFKDCPNLLDISMPLDFDVLLMDGMLYDDFYFEDCRQVMVDLFGCKSVKKVTITTGKAILGRMFEGLDSLEEVILPESLTTIGSCAFKGCENITEIDLPESVKYIQDCAFESCTGLKEIKLPSQLEMIDYFAFTGCSSLKEIVIPDSVQSIYPGAFSSCENLGSVVMGENIGVLGENMFKDCPNLFEILMPSDFDVLLMEGSFYSPFDIKDYRPVLSDLLGCEAVRKVTITTGEKVSIRMFEGVTSLEEVVLPEGLEDIESGAFRNCKNLKKINLPESLVNIYDFAFESCTGLTEIELPSQLKSIDYFAFTGCSSLKEIVIPDSVRSIYPGAFSSCENLGSVVMGENVGVLGENMFKDCPNLFEIAMPSECDVALMDGSSFNTNTNYTGRPLLSIALGCNTVKKVTITKGEEIPDFAFSGCTSLESVIIPSTIKKIECYAFKDCTSLKSITIPSTVKEIRYRAFEKCTELTDVTFEDGVEEIYGEAFIGCTKLSNINFGKTVTYLGDYAFRGCTSLKKVIVPDSIKALGLGVFAECESLESAVIGNGMIQIGESVFRNCYNLKELSMPLYNFIIDTKEDGYFYPGSIWVSWDPDNEVRLAKLFDGMRDPDQYALRKLNITSMENSNIFTTFIGYENGELVSEAAYGVPEKLFEGMSMLTDITFGDTVMSVSAGVFSDCTNLENLTFKSENVHIKEGALLETDAVLHCYEDSMVHKYAVKNNLPYVLLEEDAVSREVGDLNNDSVVELTDLTILSLYLIGDRSLDESDLAYADVTKNGKVDIADLAALKQYIMKS